MEGAGGGRDLLSKEEGNIGGKRRALLVVLGVGRLILGFAVATAAATVDTGAEIVIFVLLSEDENGWNLRKRVEN